MRKIAQLPEMVSTGRARDNGKSYLEATWLILFAVVSNSLAMAKAAAIPVQRQAFCQ